MDSSRSQDGHMFVSALVRFIQKHEKAFANALQLTVSRQNSSSNLNATSTTPQSSSSSAFANAFSFSGLSFRSRNHKSAQLTLTPHHLFYLLSRIEELDVDVGPMSIRTENIHDGASTGSYVSFLQSRAPAKERSGDSDSMHSVSSVRSAVSGIAAFWSTIGLSTESSRSEKAKVAALNELKYLYSTFTKMPALRLGPDYHCPLIEGFEQFPFETAVPVFAFKNLQKLEIVDLDFRTVFGWDRLAEQLRFLTVRRANVEDPADVLTHIVLDDAEKRRRRSTRRRGGSTPMQAWSVPSTPRVADSQSQSDSSSPKNITPGTSPVRNAERSKPLIDIPPGQRSISSHLLVDGSPPKRPIPNRTRTSYRHIRTYSTRATRAGSSCSTDPTATSTRDGNQDTLSASKWQWLVYLSLADNGLHTLPAQSLVPVASSLRYMTLSSNLFTAIPDSLSTLTRLTAVDLSNCMIDSLQSLVNHPLGAITYLNLKSNRLHSLAGIERLPSLEKLDIQNNDLSDPAEIARLSAMPNLKRLSIKRNPFTRTYSDYRIRIMNIFRRASHFTEDIILDDQPVLNSERKYLIEPLSKSEALTTVASAGDIASMDMKQSSALQEAFARSKPTRKRVVDLSETSVHPKGGQLPQYHAPTILAVPVGESKSLECFSHPSTLSDHALAVQHELGIHSNVASNEGYHRDIEELRLQFGHNWLGALKDQPWQAGHDILAPTQNGGIMRPPIPHHHTSPCILTVGGNIT